MLKIQKIIRSKKNYKKALLLMKFFKTGKGEYAEGDVFLGGWNSLELKLIAQDFKELKFIEIKTLLKSIYHEERMAGLNILILKYKDNPKQVVDFYLKNKSGINNWDLVDCSIYKILGDYCVKNNDSSMIIKLSQSERHWDKRMAMVATLAFIREKQLSLTFKLAKKFLKEKEDLMHKACGWMLREAGKKDEKQLLDFIKKNGKKMPRTMLRYSLERIRPNLRAQILKETR